MFFSGILNIFRNVFLFKINWYFFDYFLSLVFRILVETCCLKFLRRNISNCLLTIAYRMTFDLVFCSAAVQNCLKISSFFVLKHRALKTLLRYQRIGELQFKDLLTLFQSKFMKFKARVLRVILRQQYGITIVCFHVTSQTYHPPCWRSKEPTWRLLIRNSRHKTL